MGIQSVRKMVIPGIENKLFGKSDVDTFDITLAFDSSGVIGILIGIL